MKRILFVSALVFAAVGCGSAKKAETPAHTPHPLPKSISEAVSSEFRSPENKARDVHRHPVETLTFFGLEPQMTVIEVSPGAGWYTQILLPLLAENGQYIAAAVPSSTGDYMKNLNEKQATWLAAHPELAPKFKVTDFNPPEQVDIAPEGTADMVVTFRNVHNWMAKGAEQAAFNSFFKALKPGGILGVTEHRANPKQKTDPKASSGYVREKDVIRMAEKAGFKLVAKSEVNANPKDTKDHPEGVWTLPPSLRLKEKDRDKYVAIGESDRMTLKFMKPKKKK
ncbi:MAG: class I SAM-dependent methyltransferase [Bdellovibrionales bacterium]|nr:class I SAM-dependent methyltransferase [Bdellovibrionales bacterium]